VFTLSEELLNYAPPSFQQFKLTHFNFLIVGGMGTGKSSLINTLLTALDSRIRTDQKVRDNPEEHITRHFSKALLTSNLIVADSWGWSKDNYNRREFEYMLQGRLKTSAPLTAGVEIDKHLKIFTSETEGLQERIHCVILVIPAKSYDNLDYIKRLKEFKKVIEENDVEFIVAVTQIDKLEENLALHVERVNLYDSVSQVKKKIAKIVELPSRNVLVVKNYESENDKK